MKLFNKKQVITLAFKTDLKANQLSKKEQFALIEKSQAQSLDFSAAVQSLEKINQIELS